MAIMIPPYVKKEATAGARWLFAFLKANLSDEHVVYQEALIGSSHVDFIVIVPTKGILVIELKDYVLSSILEANSETWKIKVKDGEESKLNPLIQAKSYAFQIGDLLKADKHLKSNGKLTFVYGFCVMFHNLKHKEFIDSGLYRTMDMNKAIFRHKLEEDPSNLLRTLESMFVYSSNSKYMTPETIDRVRYHLFPEVRITADYSEEALLGFDTVRSMSLYQESIAKQTGEGHRLIRGVSGAGKTLILAARAKLLANKHPEYKILVVCVTVVLSRYIRQMIPQKQYPNILVYSFYEFVRDVFGESREDKINASLTAVNPDVVFDSILIDEGQDFEGDWIALLANCVSPHTKSFFIAEDRAQVIYKRKKSLAQMSGMDFRGRSRVLSINYRNTANVVKLAWEFYQNFVKELAPEIIPPRSTYREGPPVRLQKFYSPQSQYTWLCSEILHLIERGVRPEHIGILYRVKKWKGVELIQMLFNEFEQAGINAQWISESRDSKSSFFIRQGIVNVLTMDSAKGLDFRVVFIVDVQNNPLVMEEDKDREAALFYIAMTRAMEYLYITWIGKSEYTDYLEQVQRSNRDLSGSNSFS